ncbi:MAG: tetratricopeptide repeat protein, partial [Planctomycetota bacterium]
LKRFANILLNCVPTDMRDIPTALQVAREAAELSGGSDAAVLNTLARAHHEAGGSGEAAEIQRRAVAKLPEGSPYHPTYSAHLAEYLSSSGDTIGAEHAASEVIAVSRSALGDNELLLAERLRVGGLYMFDDGYYFGAERLFLEALELYRRLLGEEHEYVAYILGYLGNLYYRQGKFEHAEQKYRAALEIWRNTLDNEDLRAANTLHTLATVLHARGDVVNASEALRDSLAVYETVAVAEIPAILDIKCDLAAALTDLDRLDEAEPLAMEALTVARELFDEHHSTTALAMQTMGLLLTKQGHPEQAEPTLRRCVQILGELDLAKHLRWRIAQAESTLGYSLLKLKRIDEAEPLLINGAISLAGDANAFKPHKELVIRRVVELHTVRGESERAAAWQRKLPLNRNQ